MNKKFLMLSPMLAMFILTLGNGFFTTYTTVEIHRLGYQAVMVGWVAASYYFGLMLGSYSCQKFIRRIGYIRAHATFSALFAAGALLQALIGSVWVWIIFRFMVGYSLAGLFVVIEAWLVERADARSTGLVMAIYIFVYYLAMMLSQLILKIPFSFAIQAFALVGLLAVISIVPVAVTKHDAPPLSQASSLSFKALWQQAPLGVFLGFIAGACLAVLYTVLPFFLKQIGLNNDHVAWLMFLTILGGALWQIPLGKLSDHIDRRIVILLLSLGCIPFSIGIIFNAGHVFRLGILLFMLGGVLFPLYPLAITHTADCVGKKNTVGAMAMLTLFFGVGSAVGPITATHMITILGKNGLFWFVAMASFVLVLYTLWRLLARPNILSEAQSYPENQVSESTLISSDVSKKEFDEKNDH